MCNLKSKCITVWYIFCGVYLHNKLPFQAFVDKKMEKFCCPMHSLHGASLLSCET